MALAGWAGQAPGGEAPERFYPIGIYGVPSTNDFKVIKDAGFNLVVGRADKDYLDAAQAFGLKVLASGPTSPGPKFDPQAAGRAIAAYDGHPALWAWYLIDEPDFVEMPPEEVLKAERGYKSLGARKPTALVLYQGYEALDYGNLTDILMVDRYPVPWLPLANFGQHVRMSRLALGRNKPLMAVIQAFDWSSCPQMLPGETNLRPPTGEEMRCMTYEALARGANGVFYFAYDAGWKMREHPDTWAALQAVVREVNDRLPLFSGTPLWWPKCHDFGEPKQRFNAALESSVTSCLLRVDATNASIAKGDYIVAVNNTPNPLEYSFALPARSSTTIETKPGELTAKEGKPRALPVLGENRVLESAQGRVKDRFERYAIHVYGPVD